MVIAWTVRLSIVHVEAVGFRIEYTAELSILLRPINRAGPLTFQTFYKIVAKMSPSIQSATRLNEVLFSRSGKGRKINVDFVLDRKSV